MTEFAYKHVLLIGATSGIGQAMAVKMLQHGIQVTAVGRRQERLDALVQEYGTDKAHGVAFDISKLEAIPTFVAQYGAPNICSDGIFQPNKAIFQIG